jgi:SAM-dependent methyltransferase
MREPLIGDDTRKRLRRLRHPAWLGTMRRLTPLSYHWGRERGTPIDRYYIERFLATHADDVRGRVLEVMDQRYTERFGRAVERSEVLDVDQTNRRATIVGDLGTPQSLPEGAFDCFLLTQTLQFVYDVKTATREVHRTLRSGGVVLATVPAVSKIDHTAGLEGDFWRFTSASCSKLFEGVFGSDRVQVESYGNVLAAAAFLMGMASEELRPRELDELDLCFPVLIGVRAVKA